MVSNCLMKLSLAISLLLSQSTPSLGVRSAFVPTEIDYSPSFRPLFPLSVRRNVVLDDANDTVMLHCWGRGGLPVPFLVSRSSSSSLSRSAILSMRQGGGFDGDEDDDKFSFAQRIESIKCVVVGALSGGVALTPFTALHDIFVGGGGLVQNGVAQWEFDTDMGSIQTALFAIVYRYCVREDVNPMLNQGVVGAFVLVRTLSRISVPTYCTAAPLDCGDPLSYFDWDMLSQLVLSGLESAAMFGAAAAAMEYCFSRKIISKFP